VLMALSAATFAERWLVASLGLYAVAGLFWIPVIFMQIEMRNLARVAAAQGQPLPPRRQLTRAAEHTSPGRGRRKPGR